jgi:hypothetical protein
MTGDTVSTDFIGGPQTLHEKNKCSYGILNKGTIISITSISSGTANAEHIFQIIMFIA